MVELTQWPNNRNNKKKQSYSKVLSIVRNNKPKLADEICMAQVKNIQDKNKTGSKQHIKELRSYIVLKTCI